MHPAPADVPGWLQAGVGFAGMLAVFVGTLRAYIRKGSEAKAGSEVAVVSATFADRRTIEHLADTIERLERAVSDATEESRRVRQSVIENTDAQINLLRFLRTHSAD